MTPDYYLGQVLSAISAPSGVFGPGQRVRNELLPLIQEWGGTQLSTVFLSGSYSKGTNIVGGSDVDLFISLSSNTQGTLKELYQNLSSFVSAHGYTVRRQNVSVRIPHNGLSVDLTPGRRQFMIGQDHSIYVSRQDTWQKTNVQTHATVIGNSGHTDVIRLTKRWRDVHRLEFPSFAAELAVLAALRASTTRSISQRLLIVLEFLRDRMNSAVLNDPANTNNNVAAEMTVAEKTAVAGTARASLSKPDWGQIIW